MRAVHLPVDVAGINEQHRVGATTFAFALVEEPECAGERDGVEEVRADGDHHVHGAAFDELVAEFLFGGAGVGGGVGHDEAGPALFIERGVEQLNPEVIGVVGARQAEGEAASRSDHVFQSFLVHGVDVERRVGEDEVEAARGVVRVVVVAVDVAAVFDFAFEAVDGEIQAAEAAGFIGFLDAVDGEFGGGILLMLGDEARGGDEHAARTARGVEDAPVVGLDDFGEEADDAAGGVKFAAALALAHGELAEEVFVDAPEGVVVQRSGNLGDALEQFLEEGAGEEVVGLGQDAGELRVVLLDVAHGGIDLRADVLGFRQAQQVIEPRLGGQIKDALGVVGGGFIHARSTAG